MAFNDGLWSRVWNEYRESPGLWLGCVTKNLYNFWFSGKTWTVTAVNMVIQLPYMILAILGAYAGFRTGRGRYIGPILLLIAYVMSVHVSILAQARYSVPLMPVIAVLAAMGLLRALRSARQRATVPGTWAGTRQRFPD